MGFSPKYIFPLKMLLMLFKFQYVIGFIRKQNIYLRSCFSQFLYFLERHFFSLQMRGSRARSCSSGGGRGAGTAEAHRWRCGSSAPGLWLQSRAAGRPVGKGAPLLPSARPSAGEDSRLKFRALERRAPAFSRDGSVLWIPQQLPHTKMPLGHPVGAGYGAGGAPRAAASRLQQGQPSHRAPLSCLVAGTGPVKFGSFAAVRNLGPALRTAVRSVWRTPARALHVGARQEAARVRTRPRVPSAPG